MAETKEKMKDVKESIVQTETGIAHQMTNPENGQTTSVPLAGITLEQLMILVKELRKPDDETLAKKEAEAERRQESMRQMIALANAEIQARTNREANCDHKKERGETAFHGQVFSDGFYRGICLHCQKVSAPVKITSAMLGGAGL